MDACDDIAMAPCMGGSPVEPQRIASVIVETFDEEYGEPEKIMLEK